jgi:soluble lytic murein transglycosylase-like protein
VLTQKSPPQWRVHGAFWLVSTRNNAVDVAVANVKETLAPSELWRCGGLKLAAPPEKQPNVGNSGRARPFSRNMRSLAGSALVLGLLVSLFDAVGLTERAMAAESEENGAAEGGQTSSQPVSTETICSALAAAAAQNDLPTDSFARLIWQESRFNPAAVSRAGAQGVAQFMPATANWRGLPTLLTRSKPLPTPQSSCPICVANSEILCADLRGAGVSYCKVQRTTSAR